MVFGIALEPCANIAGCDGAFRAGPLAGKRANVKLHGKRENILDINAAAVPDYLVR
jgi:hypothetical protein